MPTINVQQLSGEVIALNPATGQSLMEGLREGGVEEILAICGGVLSCATCHVYIENPEPHGIPSMSEDESDLLELSEHRKETSRLSCQIPITAELEGLNVEVAPED